MHLRSVKSQDVGSMFKPKIRGEEKIDYFDLNMVVNISQAGSNVWVFFCFFLPRCPVPQ